MQYIIEAVYFSVLQSGAIGLPVEKYNSVCADTAPAIITINNHSFKTTSLKTELSNGTFILPALNFTIKKAFAYRTS